MYTIYHVPGIKVGCSIEPDKRVKVQGYDSYEVLEVIPTIEEASKREIYWQNKLGYGRDNPATYEELAKTWSGPIRERALKKYKETIKVSEKYKATRTGKGFHTPEARVKWLAAINSPEVRAKTIQTRIKNGTLNCTQNAHIASQTPEAKAKRLLTFRTTSGKTVLQYDLQGNFIREWECYIDAEKALKEKLGITAQGICHCLKGRQRHCKGFVWKYKNV